MSAFNVFLNCTSKGGFTVLIPTVNVAVIELLCLCCERKSLGTEGRVLHIFSNTYLTHKSSKKQLGNIPLSCIFKSKFW